MTKINPIFVALDVDERSQAIELARKVAPFVGGFKVGPRLCMRYGSELIQQLAGFGPVFVDNKYFDIPSTMVAAVRAAHQAGASFVTVHAQAGPEALQELYKLEVELAKIRPLKILAVTVLTSFTQATLPVVSQAMPIAQQVQALAALTVQSGLSAVVCSPQEVAQLKSQFPQLDLVVPGIRFPDDQSGDQKRVSGPRETILAGASYLVVGRPIIAASDPAAAAQKFHQAVQHGQ